MGPFPPPALPEDQINPDRKQTLRWLDDGKDIKEKLKTNISSEDLSLQDLDGLKAITTHRDNVASNYKPAIKKFILDVN
jgi:hypothetical protein